jgi:hypothetical protein
MDPTSLIAEGLKLAFAVGQAIITEIQRGGTRATMIAAAEGVIDRAKAVDADVDAVAMGRR